MNKKEYESIPASAFEFVPEEGRMHDKKLESKPIGYFRDAFNRFCWNKSSVVAAFIIMLLVLYAIFVPIFCENNYTRALTDTTYTYYTKLPPKSSALAWLGLDGTRVEPISEGNYKKYLAFTEETGYVTVLAEYGEPFVSPDQQAAHDKKIETLRQEVENAKNPALKKQKQKNLDKALNEVLPLQYMLKTNPYYLMGPTTGMIQLEMTRAQLDAV